MLSSNDVLQSGILDFTVFSVPERFPDGCKGQNKKGLLIVLGEKESEELRIFLEKVMQSVGINPEEDALRFSLEGEESLWLAGLPPDFSCRRLICFGLPPSALGLNLQPGRYVPFFLNGRIFLFADLLSGILRNAALKRPLWEALKEMFKDMEQSEASNFASH